MAANNTMGKSFFLFYVDLPQVARMIVEQSYKAIANAYKRKNHESELNQRLMDKYERIEAISANLKNSEEFESSESLQLQLQEVQDMIHKFVFLGDDRNIVQVFVNGKCVKNIISDVNNGTK